jgi:hypothetical protein
MGFLDKRLLLSTENCLDWVVIGSVTYMSVVNETNNYTRIYSSTNGGPLTTIGEAVLSGSGSQRPFRLFKLGTTLYRGAYGTNTNMWKLDSYVSGTTWTWLGYFNNAEKCLQIRYYDGGVYFLFNGYNGGHAVANSWLAKLDLATPSKFTVIRQQGESTGDNRSMRSFDIGPDGTFYIMDQNQGQGSGGCKVYKFTGGVASPIYSFPSGDALQVLFYDGRLYTLRAGTNLHTFGYLTTLDNTANEFIIDNTSLLNGTVGANTYRFGRSQVVNDMLVFAYNKLDGGSNQSAQFFTYDTTESDLDILENYPGQQGNADYNGDFYLGTDEVIYGVAGKFVYLYHQAPDDPDPEPEPEPTIEQLTEEITVEIRKAPCSPVTLCWLNSLGGWDMFCFEDKTGAFEDEIKTRIDSQYSRYVEYLDVDTTPTGITYKSVERSKVIGADNIDPDIFLGLIELFTSPAVFMLTSADPIVWQAVQVAPGTLKYSEYDKQIEITLALPGMYLQRN